jgi:choline dehydrogenase-like flavoprotein
MLSTSERKIIEAFAQAIISEGKYFGQGGKKDIDRLEEFLKDKKFLELPIRIFLQGLNLYSRIKLSKEFYLADESERQKMIEKMMKSRLLLLSAPCDTLTLLLRFIHFYDKEVYEKLGCPWDKSPKFVAEHPYSKHILRCDDFADGETIECDVVVIGSGAGGAPVASFLAEKLIATVIIEEGKYYTRKDFTGQSYDSVRKFYRPIREMIAISNVPTIIPAGRLVGGSTAVNTGTCWRTPENILKKWSDELSLKELSPEKMSKYFERVENKIKVEEAKDKVIGPIKDVISKGADAMGLRHFRLKRNAPDCDGSAVCNFGCPTDARLSTNLSYIPDALKSGAVLITCAKAEKIIIENGKACGVEVKSTESHKRIKIRAKAVVVACGTIMTPVLLTKSGVKNSKLGKNLTIHPSVNVGAIFENEQISPHKYAPQAYCVDLREKGILLLHGGLPPEFAATQIPYIGKEFSNIMSKYENTAWFGALCEDRPSGMVFQLNGKPIIFYFLREMERKMLEEGVKVVAKIFFFAGAKEVFLPSRNIRSAKSISEIEKISNMKFSYIVGFHPLGTARMAKSPKYGVVDENHETFGVKNLFVVDGSAVPTAIGVNPQVTIMALAERAAEKIAERF